MPAATEDKFDLLEASAAENALHIYSLPLDSMSLCLKFKFHDNIWYQFDCAILPFGYCTVRG